MRAESPSFGLVVAPQQRTAELVQVLAFHDDAVRGALEGLHVVGGDAHVLEAQRLEGLEAEDVADDGAGEVGDGAFLEQVEVVGDPGDELARGARDLLDPVALGLVVVVGGQPVGPHHRPGCGAGLAGHRGAGLLRRNAFL